MAKKNKTMIGHDPLAWLKDDAEDTSVSEADENTAGKEKKKKKTVTKKATAKASTKEKSGKSKNDDVVFEIQAVQDISTVAEVYKELKNLFSNKKIILDGDNIERIDGASLQLFYLFIEEAKVKNIEVAWRSPSEPLSKSAGLLGMKEALLLDKVA